MMRLQTLGVHCVKNMPHVSDDSAYIFVSFILTKNNLKNKCSVYFIEHYFVKSLLKFVTLVEIKAILSASEK